MILSDIYWGLNPDLLTPGQVAVEVLKLPSYRKQL